MTMALYRNALIPFFVGAVWLLSSGPALSLEQPKYKVIHLQDDIEFRQYEPYLITETFVANESGQQDPHKNWKKAGKVGFKRLFRYITGNNISQSDIDMTTPVNVEASSEDIACAECSKRQWLHRFLCAAQALYHGNGAHPLRLPSKNRAGRGRDGRGDSLLWALDGEEF